MEPEFATDALAKLPPSRGKTVVITGTTSGIGRSVSRMLVEKGVNVIMLNRPSERAEKAVEDMEKCILAPDREAGVFVTHVDCDLASFQSTANAARQVRAIIEGNGGITLDVLALNAGIFPCEDTFTEDGFDPGMQTNVLSHFLLVVELMDLLEASPFGGRIITHTSESRKHSAPLKQQYLEAPPIPCTVFPCCHAPSYYRYSQSKLACFVLAGELSRRLKSSGSSVIALTTHPGTTDTSLGPGAAQQAGCLCGPYLSCIISCYSWTGYYQHQDDGAMNMVHCCISPDVQSGEMYGPSGKHELRGPTTKLQWDPPFKRYEGRMLWKACEKAVSDFTVHENNSPAPSSQP